MKTKVVLWPKKSSLTSTSPIVHDDDFAGPLLFCLGLLWCRLFNWCGDDYRLGRGLWFLGRRFGLGFAGDLFLKVLSGDFVECA